MRLQFANGFQSALPRRERREVVIKLKFTQNISIRAPAKGATFFWKFSCDSQRISIRAPAKGATCLCFRKLLLSVFQSALPRRERHTWHNQITMLKEFQSALPRRERLSVKCLVLIPIRFQSALPRRERRLLG